MNEASAPSATQNQSVMKACITETRTPYTPSFWFETIPCRGRSGSTYQHCYRRVRTLMTAPSHDFALSMSRQHFVLSLILVDRYLGDVVDEDCHRVLPA